MTEQYEHYQQSTLDALREEIDGQGVSGAECVLLIRQVENAQAEVERLRGELAAVREDAERWRKLRNGKHCSAVLDIIWLGMVRYVQILDCGDQLDAAIDAARKENP